MLFSSNSSRIKHLEPKRKLFRCYCKLHINSDFNNEHGLTKGNPPSYPYPITAPNSQLCYTTPFHVLAHHTTPNHALTQQHTHTYNAPSHAECVTGLKKGSRSVSRTYPPLFFPEYPFRTCAFKLLFSDIPSPFRCQTPITHVTGPFIPKQCSHHHGL